MKDEASELLRKAIAAAVDQTNALTINAAADLIFLALTSNHRTLQQKFLGAFKLALVKYARASCDPRNQAAVEWAQQVSELPNSDLRFPCI